MQPLAAASFPCLIPCQVQAVTLTPSVLPCSRPNLLSRPHPARFIGRSKPKAVIAFIHNGDVEGLSHMRQLHPNLHLFTLSPHVAQ